MLTTKATALKQICLVALANSREFTAPTCRADACSVWRWEREEPGPDGKSRFGYCGLVGPIVFPDRYLKNKKKEALRGRAA